MKVLVSALVIPGLLTLLIGTASVTASPMNGIEYVDGKPFLNGDPYSAKAMAIAANHEVLRSLVDLVKVDPRLAGGWWNEDGTLTVQYATSEVPSDLYALAPDNLVHWQPAKFSNADLAKVIEAIDGWVTSQTVVDEDGNLTTPAKFPWDTIKVDAYTNRVIIGSPAGKALPFLSQFDDRIVYEAADSPVPVTCSSLANCQPWRGGLIAETQPSIDLDNHGSFTLAAHVVGNVNYCYMMSAGHLGFAPNNSWILHAYHHGDPVGLATQSFDTLYNDASPRSDSRRVTRYYCNDPVGGAASNSLYKNDNNRDHPMGHIDTWIGELNGDPVCKNGSGGGYHCGTITNDAFFFTDASPQGDRSVGPGIQIGGMVFGSVVGGDSGAPYWMQNTDDLMGIIAIGAPLGDWGGGTTTDYAATDTQIIWCLNATCTNANNIFW